MKLDIDIMDNHVENLPVAPFSTKCQKVEKYVLASGPRSGAPQRFNARVTMAWVSPALLDVAYRRMPSFCVRRIIQIHTQWLALQTSPNLYACLQRGGMLWTAANYGNIIAVARHMHNFFGKVVDSTT